MSLQMPQPEDGGRVSIQVSTSLSKGFDLKAKSGEKDCPVKNKKLTM